MSDDPIKDAIDASIIAKLLMRGSPLTSITHIKEECRAHIEEYFPKAYLCLLSIETFGSEAARALEPTLFEEGERELDSVTPATLFDKIET